MPDFILKYIPVQKNTGPIIGAMKDVFGRSLFYISIINFFLLIVTAYYTTIRNVVSIPFSWFIGFTMILIILAMIFEYVFVMPSSYAFANTQSYKHHNPLKDDVKLILERLDEIEENIKSK